MRDPIDELENFDPGPAMTPMPAADVRRRGDRIRRRNNALATVGGLAAVAALAVPFAVFAGGQNSAESPDPAPAPKVEWVQEIPEDFPLTDGLPESTQERDGDYEQQHVDVCDNQSWNADGVSDVRQATYTGETEGGSDRVLGVYPSDREAATELLRVSSSVAACMLQTENAKQRRVELVPSDVGDASVAYANHMSDAGDMFVVQLVRVGNAILQDSTYSFGGGDPQLVQEAVDLVTEKSAGVVNAMCVFAENPCSSPPAMEPTTPENGEGAVSAIPSDFALDRGLTSPEGDPLVGPSATADGVVALNLCGQPVWPVEGVERLAVTATGPEYREARELVTFASVGELTAALDALREAARTCPDVTPQDVAPDGADDAVTFARIPAEGLGGEVYQFAQVGRALYATFQVGEWSVETLPSGVEQLTARTEDMLPDLCIWTETGC